MREKEMDNHEKPVVFFSHSSKDSELVKIIEDRLNKVYVNSIDFFVSSDGASIAYGTNWVNRIHEQLENAKLLFIILTPNSYQAPWLYYESGFASGQNKTETVPIGIGIKVEDIKGPLQFQQAFNVNSEQSLNNIITIINKKFDLTGDEHAFTTQDFTQIKDLANGRIPTTEENYFYSIQAETNLDVIGSSKFNQNEKRPKTSKEDIEHFQDAAHSLINKLGINGITFTDKTGLYSVGHRYISTLVDGVSIDIDVPNEEYIRHDYNDYFSVKINASAFAIEKTLNIYNLIQEIFGTPIPLLLNLKPYISIPETNEDISALLANNSDIKTANSSGTLFSFSGIQFDLTSRGVPF
ncbi:toll/interleukin-1 receptor domain-containing protein [Bifidobacterium sp. ESL0798]|uniref:toll/interleukin-1 receptor domain-containing protein n=1 Tax=Bifidobacterium sp. ESL0798 TaxID=2983235 RepID=UPI0023F811DD|nr:toll/interleukin-1 receptor domain-containing protein [Bifidobacterium sp. ESL0798]WEV73455.1 toll/interleukin-1 receptor domain-containing protein [Bifidobacterium sp. ESL0798]